MQFKSYIIEQDIKKIDKNLVLFYGENVGLKSELKSKIRKAYMNFESLRYDCDELVKNESIIHNEINNISLFEKEKYFIIEQASDKILHLIEKLEKNIFNSKIFLFAEILDKKSKLRNLFEKSNKCGAVACYKDNEITIRKIIQNKLKDFKGINSTIINVILESSNLDRMKVNNELEKIVTHFSSKELELEKIKALLNHNINEDFNLLRDCAFLGNKTRTGKLLDDTIIEDDKSIYYLSVINQRLYKLKDIIEASKKSSLHDALEKLKPPIFWKDKPNFLEQAKKWNTTKIKELLNKTYDFEIIIKKNSQITKNILVKKLMLDICNQANS